MTDKDFILPYTKPLKEVVDDVWRAALNFDRLIFTKALEAFADRKCSDWFRVGWEIDVKNKEDVIKLLRNVAVAAHKQWEEAVRVGDAPNEDVSPAEGFEKIIDILEADPEPMAEEGGIAPIVKFKKLDPNATLPAYAHDGDAGMDIKANEDVDLFAGKPQLIHTGIACEIPAGYELQVCPRSGLSLKGVTVYNAPGIVDSNYRGEIGVIALFIAPPARQDSDGIGIGVQPFMEALGAPNTEEPKYVVHKGDKIAQLVLVPAPKAQIKEVTELSDSNRGTAGFGSTGM